MPTRKNKDGLDEKYCKKCDTFKLFSEFDKDASKTYGLASYCKPCKATDLREQYSQRNQRKSRLYRKVDKDGVGMLKNKEIFKLAQASIQDELDREPEYHDMSDDARERLKEAILIIGLSDKVYRLAYQFLDEYSILDEKFCNQFDSTVEAFLFREE